MVLKRLVIREILKIVETTSFEHGEEKEVKVKLDNGAEVVVKVVLPPILRLIRHED